MALNTKYNTKTFVSDLLRNDIDDIALSWETLENNLYMSNSSRNVTYTQMNPNLIIHDFYCNRKSVWEDHSKAFSRFRLSGGGAVDQERMGPPALGGATMCMLSSTDGNTCHTTLSFPATYS